MSKRPQERKLKFPKWMKDTQRQLYNALCFKVVSDYPLHHYYSGAIRVLSDVHNHDRVSQAANSLRELLEKLLRSVHGDVKRAENEFAQLREEIDKSLSEYKNSQGDEWDGWVDKVIDHGLDKGLVKVEHYLGLNKQPRRADWVRAAVEASYAGYTNVRGRNIEQAKEIAKRVFYDLQDFTHHNHDDIDKFEKCMKEAEEIIYIILENISVIQKAIRHLLDKADKTEGDIDSLFELVESNEANLNFFFKHITERADANWLPIIEERGYFRKPSENVYGSDGWVKTPFWLPILYLVKIATAEPDKVARIVAEIPTVDNPRICDGIAKIAMCLPADKSLEIKLKLISYIDKSFQLWGTEVDLVAHWAKANQTAAALELLQKLVGAAPDCQEKHEQQEKHQQLERDLGLSQRMDSFFFRKLMNEGVRLLVEKEPYEVAIILIKATSAMLEQEFGDGRADISGSDFWYKPDDQPSDDSRGECREVLIDAMASACEKVYEKQPDKITALDEVLCNEDRMLFVRLRQRLYRKHPREENKLSIRRLILDHDGYGKHPLSGDFWHMIKSACEHFGEDFLSIEERTQIIESINNASLEGKRDLGYTEDDLRRTQFFPFERVLFGKYLSLFHKLKEKCEQKNIPPNKVDDPYYKLPNMDRVSLFDRSPFSLDELGRLSDEGLLDRINTWDKERRVTESDSFLFVNRNGLAAMIHTVFKDRIVCDRERMRFWLKNCDKIKYPVYIQEIIYAMYELIKAEKYGLIDDYLAFGKRTLSRTASESDSEQGGNTLHREPSWPSLGWAICRLIHAYLEKEVEPSRTTWGLLRTILTTLCTQYDYDLDSEKRRQSTLRDPLNEAINTIRGSALTALFDFTITAKRCGAEAELAVIKRIIEHRLSAQSCPSLTPEEYAVLGVYYPRISSFDEEWSSQHRPNFFPQGDLDNWVAAFGALIGYNAPGKTMFVIVRDNFDLAMQHLDKLRADRTSRNTLLDMLELRLFSFYVGGQYPLTGRNSLLDRYYQITKDNKQSRGGLLYAVGDDLRSNGDKLDKESLDKIIAFFKRRVEAGDFVKMGDFNPWLDIKQLPLKKRLGYCLKILATCQLEIFSTSVWLEKFCNMLTEYPEHTAGVIACFTKLTDCIDPAKVTHINKDYVKIIGAAGHKSKDGHVRINIGRAVSNLLNKELINNTDL